MPVYRHNFSQKLSVLIMTFPLIANAICLNPFGCDPKTEAECIRGAANAKTESAARAIISECRKLPSVTLSQCKEAELGWARYMTAHGGVEWEWPDQTVKTDCRKLSPATFSPKLWLTFWYCKVNSERLANAIYEIDSLSLRSKKLEKVRREMPYLSELDDRQVIRVLQATDYKDMSNSELAHATFIDAPPDVLLVAAECKQIQGINPR